MVIILYGFQKNLDGSLVFPDAGHRRLLKKSVLWKPTPSATRSTALSGWKCGSKMTSVTAGGPSPGTGSSKPTVRPIFHAFGYTFLGAFFGLVGWDPARNEPFALDPLYNGLQSPVYNSGNRLGEDSQTFSCTIQST